MATASELDIIRCNPMKERVGDFHHLFESTWSDLGVALSSSAVQIVFATADTPVVQKLVFPIIKALIIELAADALPSRIVNGPVSSDLSLLFAHISSNRLDIALAIPLVEQIVSSKLDGSTWNDADIWHVVFELVSRTNPATPSTVLQKAVFDTPIRSCSISQRGTKQIHDEVDQRILEELTGRVYSDVGGFFERYFEGKTWTNKAGSIYEESRAQYTEGRWREWPEPPTQIPFFKWFLEIQDTILSGLGRRYYTSPNKALGGSDTDRYAREVFGSQPERRFISGFTICGSIIRLWIFDRSGTYSSEKFDIHKEPERFIRVIAGYTLMTDAELGLNTFIKHDSNGKYIVVRDVRISLEDKPIFSTKAIVCRGTTCYRGRRGDSTEWENVVKFAWPSDKREREGELLKLAKERGVTNIAMWFSHEQIVIDGYPDIISHFRREMKFRTTRKLSSKALWVDSNQKSSRAYSQTCLGGNTGSEGELDATVAHGIQETFVDSLAECRNEWQRKNVDCKQEAETESLTDYEMYGNRVNYCLVTSPAGRPLREYQSVRELLEALRDAIRGHRSLLEDGRILHRDISENNIIITELPTKDAPKGRLIDFDLAKELDSTPCEARHRTGTMQFMAIEVLKGKGHISTRPRVIFLRLHMDMYSI
ncbi:hypothetical protein BJ875DRAFT_541575 [Amylocarpus encephaloides]|uniref:EKC/KEOPS complex subunit BUD32 n=1 Tax=Amylocarpus encephaloides TaxID=45428 RepID=A0A9P7YLU8_9HELO|nr:hypothetical protein BJ875DRAFT_541575 [Amylocarpus encephaloides]